MIKSCAELIHENKEYTKQLGFKVTEKEKTLPITYCIFKMDKNPIGVSFITSSKICSTKNISVSNLLIPQTPKLKIFIKRLHFLHTKKLWCYKMLTPSFIY